MTNVDPNLRKAAVLLRSLDADTAAVMLGQLSAEEAAKLRAAMRAVGQVDTDEQAEVMVELRRVRPTKAAPRSSGVELELSSSLANEFYDERVASPRMTEAGVATAKRFEFLESAPIKALVPHLAREHAQTIAVVLSHLAPQRAAAILAALPQKVQSETVDRLSTLGETDDECVTVLERELQSWATKRDGARVQGGRRRDTMTAILAAADAKSRNQILSSMKDHKAAVANQFIAPKSERERYSARTMNEAPRAASGTELHVSRSVEALAQRRPMETPAPRVEVPLPRVAFDDLIHLDSRALSAVLRQVDANVLALALAGSREDLVDRICEQMPKRTAREFRRELRRLGPTRLSDVEAAQRAVAHIAARLMADRRAALATSHA